MRATDGRKAGAGPCARVVAEARAAQTAWASVGLCERLAIIRSLRHKIAGECETLARAVDRRQQRAPGETLVAEVLPLLDACRFLEREAGRILAPKRLGVVGRPWWLAGVSGRIQREPLGVVLIIGPSNYPLFLPGVQAVQALAAGNAVLLKPGRGAREAAMLLARCLEEAGVDTRLFTVLEESPEAARAAMQAGVDRVVLTGSADTGRAVLSQLANTVTPATMELSGCDAAFVLEDADLELTAGALHYGLSLNRGATCIAPRRALLVHTVADELEQKLKAELQRRAPVGVDETEVPRLRELVQEALDGGARLVCGELDRPAVSGPFVLAGVSPHMRLAQEDIMASVLCMMPVQDTGDALATDALCPYALGASIFGSKGAAEALARKVHAGVVVLNDMIVPTADPRLPFGGRDLSGFGRTRGAEGLLEMTTVKTVMRRRGRHRPHFTGSGDRLAHMARSYIAAAHGRALTDRARAAFRTLGALWRALRSPNPAHEEAAV